MNIPLSQGGIEALGGEARIASGEFQQVSGQKHDSGRHFTTADIIRAEREILHQMQQGQGRAEQIMSIQQR